MSDSMGSMVVSGDLLAGRALFGTRGAHPCKRVGHSTVYFTSNGHEWERISSDSREFIPPTLIHPDSHILT